MVLISLLGSGTLYKFLPFKFRAACHLVSWYRCLYKIYRISCKLATSCFEVGDVGVLYRYQLVTNSRNYK